MTKKLLFFILFISSFASAQHISGTPWMEDLEAKKGLSSKNQINNFSIDEIRQSFDAYWEKSGRDPSAKGSGFKQFKRWEYYWEHMVDSKGFLPPPNELWQAYQEKTINNAVPNPVSSWTSLGPFVQGSLPGGQPGIGRINAIAVDPNNENIWYTGSPAGGIWKSLDAGDTWTNLFDNFPQIGVSGIAIDPNDSNIIYIATGDDDAADSFSIGVYKSLNGGQTWNETGLNPRNSPTNLLMNEIIIDPTDSQTIWVATTFGLQKSINGGDTFEIMLGDNIRDFALKPGDPDTVYALSTSEYFRTTNGEDFIQVNSTLPRVSGRQVLAVTPADPEVLYILAADTGQNDFVFQGLFRSNDSGATFTQTANTVDILERNQAFFDLTMTVSPTDANDVYMGAINIWRSLDAGDSFIRLNNNDNNVGPAYTHVDIHTLRFFGNNLFCGSDGGLYVSENNGTSFTNRSDGLVISQFYRVSVAPENPARIAGGTQDNSGFVLNNGDWNVYTGGDGMDYEIDPNNPDLIYGFTQMGGVLFITTNAGQNIGGVAAPRDASGDAIEGNWITPLTVASDGQVYSGFKGVYRLDGNQWTRISPDFRPNGNNNEIEDLEVDPNNPNILFAAESNIIYRSVDAGVTFVEVAALDSQISSITINPNNSNLLYATTSNRVGVPLFIQQQARRGVFKISLDENGGDSLIENITLNLPTGQAFFSIEAQGRDVSNPVFVGTNLGVYRFDDTLTEWEEYFTGLPSVAIGDLDINLNSGTITAATYGRGIWRSPIPVQLPSDDIGINGILLDTSAILCGEIAPQILVENQGISNITQVQISYSLNGGTPNSFETDILIASGNTATISLPFLFDSNFGLNNLNVEVTIDNDTFSDNNSSVTTFFINNPGVGDDINTFDETTDDLVTFNFVAEENSLWERGVPAGALLNSAGSGTQVYGTNLDGNHTDNTTSLLVSNCYELSSILAPVLSFNMAFDLEQNFDIVFVQYSTDDGTTWSLLGNINSQPNWYNSDRTNVSSGTDNDCQNCPGGQWTGTDATLTNYSYDFAANAANGEANLTNESNILFRIVFQSDPNVNQEGAIIDDFGVEGIQQDDDDDDNDGVLDIDDNCPLMSNASQLDSDSDGEGDICDNDDDNDGILDINDNCPLMANPNQEDVDNDGIGDICDPDADDDGVPNDLDLCPGTPIGDVVDVDGCTTFSLPVTNFRVLTTGESCINNENGSAQIEAAEALNYTGTLEGVNTDIVLTQQFTANALFENLSAGEYTLCITVEGQPEFENCFNVSITQPQMISVTTEVNSLNKEVNLVLGGGSNYTINLNGEIFRTSQSRISLPLNEVENVIEVRTDRDCQGVFLQTIFLNPEVFIYPNPIQGGDLTVLLGEKTTSNSVELSLFSIEGVAIFQKDFPVTNGTVLFNVDVLPIGVYLLNVKTDNSLLNYKIVRR